jgi:hypothetical protein
MLQAMSPTLDNISMSHGRVVTAMKISIGPGRADTSVSRKDLLHIVFRHTILDVPSGLSIPTSVLVVDIGWNATTWTYDIFHIRNKIGDATLVLH